MNISRLKRLEKRDSKKKVGNIKLPPIDTMKSEVKTIVDVDPEFYKLIEGRPIRPNTSYNTYKQNIKDIAVNKTLRGYLIDEITRIDREMENEQEIYARTTKHFEECQRSFDKFLAYDNDKTIALMRNSDNLAKELIHETEEQKAVHFEMSSIKSKLQYVEETLMILLSLEMLLYNAAPYLWKQKEKVVLSDNVTEFVTLDSDIFKSVNIDLVQERLGKLAPPKLYFETPQQLSEMFSLLEDQNLSFFLAAEELTVKKNQFFKRKKNFENLLDLESKYIQAKIEEVEELINNHVTREKEKRELFFKIMETKMKYLISSDDALKLLICVEFVYENLIASNETKLSLSDMALALETEYDNLQMELSVLDLDLVKKVEKEVWEQGAQEIKKAKEASKLLKNVDKLGVRLKSSFEPSRRQVKY